MGRNTSWQAAVARRAYRAWITVGARQAAAHAVNVVGTILLVRLLRPDDLGTLAAALFVHAVVVAASSLGLGAGLVQRSTEPELADERAAFAAQHVLATALAGLVWLAAPYVGSVYAVAPDDATRLLRAAAVAAWLAPLQAIPTSRLERHLRFGRLAVVEVAQAVVFNATAVLLLRRGLGAAGLATALVARALAGATLATLASPWRIGYAYAPARLRPLARFGIPFQAVTLVSLAKDSLTPVLIGGVAGAAAVGLVSWAQTVAAYPTLALMALQRVYVPAFARLQDDPRELGRLVERSVQAANALAAPVAVLTLVHFDALVELVFGAQWRAAEPLFLWLWAANLVVPTVTPLAGLLNALGRSRTVLAFAVLWAAATWGLGAPLVVGLGPVGFGVANAAVQVSNLWLLRIARRHVDVDLVRAVAPAWGCAALAAAASLLATHLVPATTLARLVLSLGVALAVYGLCLLAVVRARARRVPAVLGGRA
jgi:O-antigen/teichoic acid export membrane protein